VLCGALSRISVVLWPPMNNDSSGPPRETEHGIIICVLENRSFLRHVSMLVSFPDWGIIK
jgi:hypothetical protein